MTPEEMQAMIVQLQEDNATLTASLETATNTIAEQGSQIVALQEHAQKLFMKVATPEETDKEPEPEPDGVDAYLAKVTE